MTGERSVEVPIEAWRDGICRPIVDRVVTEEPLAIRIGGGSTARTLAVTMRTPGNDLELAAGFLLGEGVIRDARQIVAISTCNDAIAKPERAVDAASPSANVVDVTLRDDLAPDLFARFERHFVTSSACGVCGSGQIEELRARGIEPLANPALPSEGDPSDREPRWPLATICALPERMRASQRVFAQTGGLHAAALFDEAGTLLAVREDIGRHNAVDKLVGWAALERRLPLSRCALCVSGRAGYEIVQKAIVAGIPIVASVSAPSSLAVDLARAFNVTLVGFVRGTHANVYTVPTRFLRHS